MNDENPKRVRGEANRESDDNSHLSPRRETRILIQFHKHVTSE